MTSTFIPDGYTQAAFVKPVPKLWGGLRFSFRPTLRLERSAFLEQTKDLAADEADQKTAEFLANKIKTWDLKDQRGKAVPVTAAALLSNIHPNLFQKLAGIVFGYEVWDDDIRAEPKERDQVQADKAEAGKLGQLPGDVAEERDAKNS